MRRECRERFPRHRLQRKPLVSNPGMHPSTCVTHVPCCMSEWLTRGGGESFPGIPGACATLNFTYLSRGPWCGHDWGTSLGRNRHCVHWNARPRSTDVNKKTFGNVQKYNGRSHFISMREKLMALFQNAWLGIGHPTGNSSTLRAAYLGFNDHGMHPVSLSGRGAPSD